MTSQTETTKEIAQQIRAELKKEFPASKFSVTSDYNSITVALMSSNETPFTDGSVAGYEQLNHFYLDNYDENYLYRSPSWQGAKLLTPKAIEMLKKVTEISNRKNWDKSDIQSDYVNVNYYFSLYIGKWDKDFTVIN